MRNKISDDPAFAWWVAYTIRQRNCKVKGRYWRTTNKYGIRLPYSVEDALKIDEESDGPPFWRLAIEKEMKKINGMNAFERWDKTSPEDLRKNPQLLPTFKEIGVHMIFDIKLDGKFTRKSRLVADGHKTDAPECST